MAERLGITSLPRKGPRKITAKDASLTLGAYEVSPLDMASVYATLAAGGVACRPRGRPRRPHRDGRGAAGPGRALPPGGQPVRRRRRHQRAAARVSPGGTGFGLALDGRPAAGKTGTTNSSAATWFAGFTPQYATAVWVGDPRRSEVPAARCHGVRAVLREGVRPQHRRADLATDDGRPARRPAGAAVRAAVRRRPDRVARRRPRPARAPARRRPRRPRALRLPRQDRRRDRGAGPLFAPGQVVGQKPAAGSSVDVGSTVTLTLSEDGSAVDVVVPSPSPSTG